MGVFELQAGAVSSEWSYLDVGYWTRQLYLVLSGFRDVPSMNIEIRCNNEQRVRVVCATGTFRWADGATTVEVE